MGAYQCKIHGVTGFVQMCSHVYSDYQDKQPTITRHRVTLHLNEESTQWSINDSNNLQIGIYCFCNDCVNNYNVSNLKISEKESVELEKSAQRAVCSICFSENYGW